MNTELWHADILISDELVLDCIREQFPKLDPINAFKCLDEGWDNRVYLLNDHIIFRFPRRKVAVELINRENMILNFLKDTIDIAIPKPTYFGQATSSYLYPFHGYEKIPGHSGSHSELNEEQRINSLAPLTVFLKQLHNINDEDTLKLNMNSQETRRSDIIEMISSLNKRFQTIEEKNICQIDKCQFQREMQSASAIDLNNQSKGLIHGDLYCRHLLFNNGELSGVIDWGDSCINYHAIDLSIIHSFYPSSYHSYFIEQYGPIPEETWQFSRFVALYIMLTIIPYSEDIGDSMLLAEAIASVQRINPDLIKIDIR